MISTLDINDNKMIKDKLVKSIPCITSKIDIQEQTLPRITSKIDIQEQTLPRITSKIDNDQEVLNYIKTIQKYSKSLEINMFLMIKDTIKNGRKLSEIELHNIDKLSSNEKIEIIKLYNLMYSELINLITSN
jgi:hypothetical protein